jgi:hypothetical protein
MNPNDFDDDFLSDRWTGRPSAWSRPSRRSARSRRGRGGDGFGPDPLRTRLGVAVFTFVLLVPVAISLRDDQSVIGSTGAPGAVALFEPAGALPALPLPDPTTAPEEPTAFAAVPSALPATPVPAPPVPAPPAPAAETLPVAAEVQTPAERVCAQRFTVRPGDYWIGLADGAQVALRDLLAANGATVSSPLYPGDEICLPAGARTPPSTTTTTAAPPTTRPPAPATTSPPAPTPRATPAPATTAAPRPPTTSAPAPTSPSRNYSRDEVIQIIRDVWPDELEEQAIRIVQRESNFRPTAKNFCCYGLFQIYYQVHRGWLSGIGVTSGDQLFDPVVNARAAYTLYQRSGGWGPWSQTAG